jgi:hypothetical protein
MTRRRVGASEGPARLCEIRTMRFVLVMAKNPESLRPATTAEINDPSSQDCLGIAFVSRS